MNPRFPLYIPSKSRAKTGTTARALDDLGVPYRIVVEEQQLGDYAAEFPRSKLLVLDPEYQRTYDTFDDLGDKKSKGPGPARNFIWEHSISEGHPWHWVMDDNIKLFARLHQNVRRRVADGTMFAAMEDFCLRYSNVRGLLAVQGDATAQEAWAAARAARVRHADGGLIERPGGRRGRSADVPREVRYIHPCQASNSTYGQTEQVNA